MDRYILEFPIARGVLDKAVCVLYIKTHPLVFNQPWDGGYLWGYVAYALTAKFWIHVCVCCSFPWLLVSDRQSFQWWECAQKRV